MKKSEIVARTITEELLAQRASAGSVIDAEDDLIRRLDVSRGTLREALRLLELLGVVESRMGRSGGVVVREPDARHFAQIVTFYLQFSGCTFGQFLEVHVSVAPIIDGIAARSVTPERAATLQAAVDTFEGLPLEEQVRYSATLTSTYYDMIDNPLWALLARSFSTVVSAHLEKLLVPQEYWPVVVKAVRRLACAIRDGDAVLAESLSRTRMQGWHEIVRTAKPDLLDERIVWATDDQLVHRGAPI